MSAIARFTLLMLALILSAVPAFAEVSPCGTLKSRKDRDACVARQAADKQTRSDEAEGKVIDPIERMKIDDDKLAKRLQGICRGC